MQVLWHKVCHFFFFNFNLNFLILAIMEAKNPKILFEFYSNCLQLEQRGLIESSLTRNPAATASKAHTRTLQNHPNRF